jgi:hypothetical protein
MEEEGLPIAPYPVEQNGINLLNEKSLHAALKQWYARPDDRLEARVDGYIIDLVRGDLLVEIQTGSFSPLKRKLARLAAGHPVRLVFPIPQEKWIVRLPREGVDEKILRRKSPRRGRVEQVFKELVYIPALLAEANFSLEVLLIREEEVRRFDAKKARAWRRKGWVTQERRLLEVVERRVFETPRDLARLLPAHLPAEFTVGELAKAAGQPDWLIRKMLYCLHALGIVARTGKRGRSQLYRQTEENNKEA